LAEHVDMMGETSNARRILVGKLRFNFEVFGFHDVSNTTYPVISLIEESKHRDTILRSPYSIVVTSETRDKEMWIVCGISLCYELETAILNTAHSACIASSYTLLCHCTNLYGNSDNTCDKGSDSKRDA
jgi:hypothetical protein